MSKKHFDFDTVLDFYLVVMTFIPLIILIASPIVLSILILAVFVPMPIEQGGGAVNYWLFILVGFLLLLEPVYLYAAKMIIYWWKY